MTTTDPIRDVTAQLIHSPSKDDWVWWPFLPVTRQVERGLELGIVYDAVGHAGLTGYSSTVFRINLFEAQTTPSREAFLATERETFDTTDELLDAGWRVD